MLITSRNKWEYKGVKKSGMQAPVTDMEASGGEASALPITPGHSTRFD